MAAFTSIVPQAVEGTQWPKVLQPPGPQKCETHGRCEFGVTLKVGWFHVSTYQAWLITKASAFIEKKQLLYFRIKIFTLSIVPYCMFPLWNLPLIFPPEKYSIKANKGKKTNHAEIYLTKLQCALWKAFWLSGSRAENGVSSFSLREYTELHLYNGAVNVFQIIIALKKAHRFDKF